MLFHLHLTTSLKTENLKVKMMRMTKMMMEKKEKLQGARRRCEQRGELRKIAEKCKKLNFSIGGIT